MLPIYAVYISEFIRTASTSKTRKTKLIKGFLFCSYSRCSYIKRIISSSRSNYSTHNCSDLGLIIKYKKPQPLRHSGYLVQNNSNSRYGINNIPINYSKGETRRLMLSYIKYRIREN